MKLKTKFFFILFCLFFVGVNYSYLLQQPVGLHFIRQTDSISFILYYLIKSNYNFFDVGNLSLTFLHGKTACEFPIVYYMMFIVFKVFGIKFVLIRWFSLLFSAVSIYCLLLTTSSFVKNTLLSIALVLLVVSSSVYRYYSINFLPDSFSISCIFIAFYHFFKFTTTRNKKPLFLFFIFASLAALIKIYYGIYFIAATFYLVYNFRKSIQEVFIYPVIFSFLIILWYAFSIYYNAKNNSTYYLMHPLPLWDLPGKDIDETMDFIWKFWYNKYYLATLFHTFLCFGILYLVPLKKSGPLKYSMFLLLSFLGCICYVVLFFKQFKHHDYYFLPIIPFLYLLCVLCISKLLKFNERKIYSTLITLVIAVIGVLGFNYTTITLDRRFDKSLDNFSIVNYQLRGITTFLDENKISKDAKFIVIGDQTINGSLIFLNRFGWTYQSFHQDSGSIKSNCQLADYLLILKPSENPIPEDFKNKLSHRDRISFRGNNIYSLKN